MNAVNWPPSVFILCGVSPADGIVEQVLGMLPYYTVQIAVTVSRHQPGRTGLQEAAEAQDMELPYRALQVSAVVWHVPSASQFKASTVRSCTQPTFLRAL